MLGDTQLIDYLGENGSSAKSLDCLLVVAEKNQQSGKTHDHTKAGHAHCLLEMKGFPKGREIDVLGIEMDDATSKQVVINVLASDANAPQVKDKVFPKHTKELAMVLHKDVTKTHEEPNVHNATTVANPN